MRSLAPLGMSGNCFCSSRSVSKRHARASTALPDVSPPKRYTYSPVGSMVVAKSDTRSGTPPGRGVQEPLARCSAGPAVSASVLSHTRSSEEMREASVLRHASAPTRAPGAASSAALSVALRESWTSRPHSAAGPSAARAPPSCLPARSSPLLPPARCEVRGARCEVRAVTCGALRRAPPRRTRRNPPLPTCTAPPRVHTPPWPRPRARARRRGNAARAAASAHGPAESLAPPCSFLIPFPSGFKKCRVSVSNLRTPDARIFGGGGRSSCSFLQPRSRSMPGPNPKPTHPAPRPAILKRASAVGYSVRGKKKRSIDDISSGLSGMPLPSQVTFRAHRDCSRPRGRGTRVAPRCACARREVETHAPRARGPNAGHTRTTC